MVGEYHSTEGRVLSNTEFSSPSLFNVWKLDKAAAGGDFHEDLLSHVPPQFPQKAATIPYSVRVRDPFTLYKLVNMNALSHRDSPVRRN